MIPSTSICNHCVHRLHEQEKTNPEEYTDRRSGDDPDGKKVEEDTDRKSPRGVARCRCSSHRGRQPLSSNIGGHARRCAEGIGKVRWIGRTLRGEFGLYISLRRQLIDQRARRNLAEHLKRHLLDATSRICEVEGSSGSSTESHLHPHNSNQT